ncbi:MAG: transposase, partial [Aestuariivita sp.]|nr:transposase [Aestuariivita sp.]
TREGVERVVLEATGRLHRRIPIGWGAVLAGPGVPHPGDCVFHSLIGAGRGADHRRLPDRPILSPMGERGSLTHRKSAARIGVAPFAADSGKLKGSRHIRGGRDRPRTVLYRTAFSATFHNPDMIAFYQRLRNGGKPHKVALVAVMRKMIVLINALLRDQRHWENRTPLTGV